MLTLAKHWTKLEDNKVRCELCPYRCVLKEGQIGVCRVRKNIGGKLYTLNYGSVSSIAVDPIEKKPLFHFKPKSEVLSLSTVGCNMRCKHCQNWEISQAGMEFPYLREMSPDEVMKIAGNYEGVAWTYNEPTIWHEFTLDVSKMAKKEGLYTVYVTNGYINEEPLREIGQYLDAMNIDVKAFRDEFYRKIAGARLQPVIDTVERAYRMGIHIELTYLIIPDLNDDSKEIRKFAEWVYELSPEIPVHFSRFFPMYKLTDKPPTPLKTMHNAYKIAKEVGLEYVYLGNTWEPEYESTYCPNCGNLLIERVYYNTELKGLTKDGRCNRCGKKINMVV
ncbi:AmmeMemoRadiSam system radical SAM enzyme [Candidatus Aciduliprofundum boonei]|uniref:Radical SAM domain protein n=1 Tax=Aciduliprofundum boonei (strain DSM 19572 / T469) TaxID=439481 RepID=B5ICX7_ACIB4|nr:AmmeMemoRadiSam system radical SAM enzyme [Candidatus Aciduliprofundum boonei]ADD09262.1 Radical SAM domain protein [Aciduliprofundum boonei T469]EDY35871.1 radical SAM domain protein [Aciduliprofundum boonei T469]HII54849.1 AmmeMemoRadiSam system radical SAM enzyme [Candidatus Aciduliprofundum boonei]